MPIQGMIRIIKTDSETGKRASRRGVYRNSYFRLALPLNGENDGEVVAVITSGEDGTGCYAAAHLG